MLQRVAPGPARASQRVATAADRRRHRHFFFVLDLAFAGGWRRGLACEALGFQALAVLRERGLGASSRSLMAVAASTWRNALRVFPLGLGHLFRRFNFARCLRHFFAFGRSTRASLNSSGPSSSSRLLRLARSSALAASSGKLSITPAANSLARLAFSCVGFTLTVSPSSNSRRIAAERVASFRSRPRFHLGHQRCRHPRCCGQIAPGRGSTGARLSVNHFHLSLMRGPGIVPSCGEVTPPHLVGAALPAIRLLGLVRRPD